MNYFLSNSVVTVICGTANAVFALSLLCLSGCVGDGKYQVLLPVDTEDYRPQMTWDQIRETGFKKPYTVRVLDAEGRVLRLYRFNHDDGSIMPLDETEVHISTPIIIEKKYVTVYLSVLDRGKEVRRVRILTSDLKGIKGGPGAYAVPY